MPRWFAVILIVSTAAPLLVLQTVYPWAALVVGSCALVGLVVYRCPVAGICLWLALFPMHSFNLSLHAFGLQSVMKNAVYIYPVEIMNVLLMLALVAQQLERRQATWNRRETRKDDTFRWLLYLAALFTALTVCVVLLSDNIPSSAIGGWRFVGNFFAMAFMVTHLRQFRQFVQVALFYTMVVAVCALLAIAATFYGFSNEYQLVQTETYGLFGQLGIFNRGGHFFAPLSGMITGYGFSGKHELSMHMMAGMTFLVFLGARQRSTIVRGVFALMLVLFTSINQQAFSKTSMAGSVFILALVVTMVAPWRKWLVAVLLVYLGVSAVGAAGAYILQPEHQTKMSSVKAQLIKTSSTSRFEPSSFGQRLYTWDRAIERIGWSGGFGKGPDSSSANRDSAFGAPHGHNIFLTLALEYGVLAAALFVVALLLTFTLSYKMVFASPRIQEAEWLLQVTLVATTLLALFEYQFDVHIHYPQLWAMIGLLLAALKNLPEESAVRENVLSFHAME